MVIIYLLIKYSFFTVFALSVYNFAAIYSIVYARRRLSMPGMSEEIR
jgi:hypothetical protein